MKTMKAVRIERFGGPETVKFEPVPKPEPGPGQLLVRVEAAAVNPIDWKLREGFFKDLPVPFTPGGDFCGIVEALDAGSAGFRVGDEVFGCAPESMGAEAEYVAVPPANAALKPKTLNAIEAASVPIAGMTAWQGLFTYGEIKEGQSVLILGASGGVGAFAVQLARWVGARVVGTASTENVQLVRSLGGHDVVDYRKERFEDAVLSVDLVLDLVGGEIQRRAFSVLRRGGRLVSSVQPPDQATARERGVAALMFRMKPDSQQLKDLARMIDAGQLRVHVAKVLPLERAAEAEEMNRRHEIAGKIVLVTGGAA